MPAVPKPSQVGKVTSIKSHDKQSSKSANALGKAKTEPYIPKGGPMGKWIAEVRERGGATAIELQDEGPSRGVKNVQRMVYYCRKLNLLKG